MDDEILQLLRRALAILGNEEKSRINSLTITKIEEAILWREFGYSLDMQHRQDR